MAIPNPNPNIEDGKKCDNKTYSSNKIESLVAAATELPTPEAGDAGKVLTVNSDADGYELDNVGGIPSITSGDAGKVITVNAGANAYELATPVAPTSIINDSTASASSVYSSSKVDTLLSGKADAADVDNATISITRKAGISESVYLPTVVRRGHVVTILFDGSLPAGTYNSVANGGTWQVDVLPRTKTTNFVVCDGTKGLAVTADGTVGFYSNATLASTSTIVGSVTYITGE